MNPELENMVSVAIGDDYNSVYAINKDGSDIKLLSGAGTCYDIDYFSGKVYLRGDDRIKVIDLTKGNGCYTIEEFASSSRLVYVAVLDGKIFTCVDKKILYIDANTKRVYTLVEADARSTFDIKLNKKLKKLFYRYVDQDSNEILAEYDIETGKTIQIDKSESYEYNGRKYWYSMLLNAISDKYLLYKKTDKENTNLGSTYLYNIETKEITKIDINGMEGCCIVGEKIFFANPDSPDIYPNYRLAVYENGNISYLNEYQPNMYTAIWDLGTGKVQALMTWGQDVSTSGSQNYIIDINTNAIEKYDKKYSSVHIIDDLENIKYEFKEDNINRISVEEAEKIIQEKFWDSDTDEKKDEVPIEHIIDVAGGPSDETIYDTEGNEYYVFTYRTVSDTVSSFVEAICISVDGTKYKMIFFGSKLCGSIITEFDEEGEL